MTYALAQLSGRERALLLVFALFAVPLAVIFLLVLPLLETRDAAREQATQAAATLAWVSDQVRAYPADTDAPGQAASTGAASMGISAIEESLVRAGLRQYVSQLANRTGGGVDLALQSVPFDQLGGWLREMTPLWGYRIAAFRFEAGDPGLVNATFELEPAP
ncbi:MAG: type II secretion system protein M [Rhodobacter sp.]|nr:type II secretion system protein M [Rhodobacter sp.]